MTFKRFITINGKKYGPYSYKSYRDNKGRVKNLYYGKKERNNEGSRVKEESSDKSLFVKSETPTSTKINFPFIPLIAVIGLFILIFSLNSSIIGFSISAFEKPEGINLDKTSFKPSENLSGYVSLYLREGELLPAQTKVVVSLEKEEQIRYSNELSLSDFFEISDIVLEKTSGSFYSTKTSLSGDGVGYGYEGMKTESPEIDFELKVTPKTIVQEVSEENQTQEAIENITEEAPSEMPAEIPAEQPPVEQPPAETPPVEQPAEQTPTEQPEQPSEASAQTESAPESSSESSPSITGAVIGFITGKAVLNADEETTISGTLTTNKPFTYSVENADISLVPGSVKIGNKTLEDSVLNIKIEDGEITVSTDYMTEEKGFGEDYLTNETERIDLDLSKLNIPLDEEGDYVAKVSFKYENSEIAKFEQNIVVNSTLEAVETTMIEDDPKFDAIIDSAEYDNETRQLTVIFHHDANQRLPVSIAFNETPIDYSFSRLVADKGENVTLTVNNWDESKYFEVKVGDHTEIIGFGKAPFYYFYGGVEDNQGKKLERKLKFIEKGAIKGLLENTTSTDQVGRGAYDIEVELYETPVKKVSFNNFDILKNVTKFIKLKNASVSGYVNSYAIDPTGLNFTDFDSLTFTATAKGTALYKCKNWNFTAETCIDGNWTKIMDITPGQNYTVTLTAADPGYAEYNSTSGTPECNSSDSPCIANTSLLKCSGPSTSPGPEPNQPNTLDTCTDKTSGACYSFYSSVENITITDLNNSVFKAGDTVNVTVSYFCYNLEQTFIWYTNSTSSINWKKVGNIACSGTIVNRTYSYSFKLDSLSGAHAVRAIIMSNPNATNQNLACPVDPQTRDVDDVTFRVDSLDSTPPLISFVFPTPNDGATINQNSVYLNTTITDASATSAFFDWNNSLFGYWAMDFYNSTGIYDNSSYNYFGTFNGGMNTSNIITAGKFGKSLDFDGSNDYLDCGNTAHFERTDSFSVEFWMNWDVSGTHAVVANLDQSASTRGWEVILEGSVIHMRLSNTWVTNMLDVSATHGMSTGAWNHVVMTYNGTSSPSGINIYINGVKKSTSTVYNTLSGTIVNSTQTLRAGGRGWGSASNYFNGKLDEVRIHNRTLSQEEISASYNNTANRLYRNFTNLTDGNYSYSTYAIDSSGNLAKSSRTVTLSLCTANMTNTTWTGWSNLSCSGNQMNQSRFLTQYDSNNCGAANLTIYEYQLVGPAYANTTWSDWVNITCLSNDKMNQSRNLTQYDTYGCASNSTFTEYRATEICDFCTPNLVNTTWSDWSNFSCSGSQMNQSRYLTQYDSNNCNEVSNQTIYSYQLVGPSLANTTFTDWYNITACLPGDYYTQERNATQYDTYSCAANSTVFEYQNLSCTYNRIPVAITPSVNPATVYTNDDLTCSFTITDEDAGDSLTANYTWYNGTSAAISGSMAVINGTEKTLTLNSGNTTKNEIWNCSVIPYDTKSYGTVKSAARAISNSLPTAPVVDVIPNSPSDNEDLVATIAAASTDADNDSITYSYQWYKNDVSQVGQTSNTLSKLLTSVGENWKCIVTPNDGTSNGATGQDNVTIFSSDTTPPAITIVNPSNGANLAAGTTSTIINITTNENAICRYNTTNPAFAFDEGTNFTTTGNAAHSFLFSGLSDGQSYSLYYKCNDSVGNVNANSTAHSFSVSAALYCGDGICNNGETCSSCPADCGSCGGGGGGGGGGGISQITDVSDSFKKAGDIVEKSLGRGNGIRFSLNNESHTIEVNQIFSDSVNLKISSEVIYVTVKNNGIEKVDINKNGYYDIAINLKSLTATAAVFEFRLLSDTESIKGQEFCNENWQCTKWTECTIEGIQVRACSDENKCGTSISKPAEIQSCTKPTCNDGIQNQEELGIDCGGPCARRCGIAEIAGSIIKVPAPEEKKKTSYGAGLILLLFMLIGMLTMTNRIEYKIKQKVPKKKDVKKVKLELLLAHIAHIMIIIAIILLVYYFVKS